MNRPTVRIPHFPHLLLLCMALAIYLPGAAFAQKLKCAGATRCPVRDRHNNILPGQCTIEDHTDPDPKGGYWKFSCTNKSAAGNFSWEYDENGAKAVKRIGKCIYDQGRNKWGWIVDPNDPKQFIGFKDTNTSRKTTGSGENKVDNGEGNERTVYHFVKADNAGTAIKQTRTKNPTGPWTEESRRSYSDIQDLIDAGFISADAPPDNYEAYLRLVAVRLISGAADVCWNAFEGSDPPLPAPVLHPGDAVYLDNVTVPRVLSHDPRFNLSSYPPGVKLTANTNVSLDNGSTLAQIQSSVGEEIYFSVIVQGAVPYFLSVAHGAPILGELWEEPLYASTAGIMDVPPPYVPMASDWTVVVLALLLTGTAFWTLRHRRAGVA